MLKISKQFYHKGGQAMSLESLAWLLYSDKQLDAAEKTASKVIDLLGDDNQLQAAKSHCLLGHISHSKGETEKAVTHYKTALRISPPNWDAQLSWTHHLLVRLYLDQGRFSDAHTHIEHAKSYAINNKYPLGWTTYTQAKIWYGESILGGAKSGALDAATMFEELGAVGMLENCRKLLCDIEEKV